MTPIRRKPSPASHHRDILQRGTMHRPVNALDVSCEMPGLVVETKRVQFSSSVIWVFPKIGAPPNHPF